MDTSTMWRLQEACQRNLLERQRIYKRLQHLTGKRSGELLCNDKNRQSGQADDCCWPCLTSFGIADARERMASPAPQPQCQQRPRLASGTKRVRQRKLRHGHIRDTGELLPPLELLVVGHQLPMHPLPMTTMRSHHTNEHLQQQQQQQQQQTHTPNQQAASRKRAKAEPPYPNNFVYFLARNCNPYQCAQPEAQAQAQAMATGLATAQPQQQLHPQLKLLSAMHVPQSQHLVLDARFMAELLDEMLL